MFLDLFDVLTLWTWNSDELRTLEESLAGLEAIAPKGARIALGMYIWDFQNHKAVPLDLMEQQCELGLKWLKEKRRDSRTLFNSTPVPERGLHLWRYTDPAKFLFERSGVADTAFGENYDAVERLEMTHLREGKIAALIGAMRGWNFMTTPEGRPGSSV